MIHSPSPVRTASYVCSLLLTFLVYVATAQDASVSTRRIPACGGSVKGQRLIGWGKYGLFFSVPKRGVEVLGGTPDDDYVKFVIKPTNHDAVLTLWFGGTAFHPDPPGEILHSSASFTQTKLLNMDGTEIGLDTKGTKPDKNRWRWFGVWAEGAVYENASAEDAALFDQIMGSACLIPYPNR